MPYSTGVRRIFRATAGVFLLLASQSVPVAGQGARGAAPQPARVAQGRDTYRQYCASCHGDQGKGGGPAAAALKTRPADLTLIAKRNGGFPVAAVEAVIKGINEAQTTEHEPVPVHGSYAMPVWGPYFTAVASNEAEAERRVTDLVTFIESIQAK